jgi:SAM-dependent methyltransferase
MPTFTNEHANVKSQMLVNRQEPGCCPACGHSGAKRWLFAPDRFHGRSQLYEIVRCPMCSLVWLKDPPAPEDMDYHYGPRYDRIIAAAGENSPGRWRARRETLDQYKSGGALLDLGCSSGSFLETMKGNKWTLSGIEISPEVAKIAEARSGAQVFVGDILAAPFPPASFDVITCFHVYEHLYDPVKVMQKVKEWLKPGGIFYFLVPNVDSGAARVFGTYWYGLELPRHLSHFSPTSLRSIAQASHLEELSITTHREPFIEYSTRYICDSMLHKIGVSRKSLSEVKTPSLPARAIRKIYRETVVRAFSSLLVLAGEGESIHAVLMRPDSDGE